MRDQLLIGVAAFATCAALIAYREWGEANVMGACLFLFVAEWCRYFREQR